MNSAKPRKDPDILSENVPWSQLDGSAPNLNHCKRRDGVSDASFNVENLEAFVNNNISYSNKKLKIRLYLAEAVYTIRIIDNYNIFKC